MAATSGRILGSLVGLAVGDAVGTTVEFMPPGSFPPITGISGGGKFSLAPGQWTDDTSMMLCLAESLIECQGFNPIDQCRRYLRWYQDGHLSSTGECFDIGMTVRSALNRFQQSGETMPYPGSSATGAAGNGCLMRLCPVPLAYRNFPDAAIEYSGLSAKVTHGTQIAVDCCKYFAGLLVGCLQGISKDELLSDKYSPIPNYWSSHSMDPEVERVVCGSYKIKSPPDIKAEGYIIDTLEAVLWAFYHTSDFKDGCLKIVNLGNDSDTVGAIYGQLAGAYYGIDDIPHEWREAIWLHSLMELFGTELESLTDKLSSKEPQEFPQPVPEKELSARYSLVKLQCYDFLEKFNHDSLYRRSQPCPKQYRQLVEFDNDVEYIKKEFTKLPASEDEMCIKIMKNFEEMWKIYRTRLERRLNR